MGLVTKPHTFSTGGTILASEHNSNLDTLYTLVNGNIEAANLANGAVTENKIADDSVATAKIQDASITAAKLAAAVQADIDAKLPKDGTGLMTGPLKIQHSSPRVELYDTDTVDKNYRMRIDGDDLQMQVMTDAGVGSGVIMQYDLANNDMKLRINNTLQVPVGIQELLNSSNAKIHVGRVNSTGTIQANSPSGWTASRTSAGVYQVTMSPALSGTAYFVFAQLLIASAGYSTYTAVVDADTFQVETFDASGHADASFLFLVFDLN